MGNRLSKIYTRTGDDGTTGLGDGTRIDKVAPRIAAIGDVDELNSALGLVLSCSDLPASMQPTLTRIQHQLFELGAELALPGQTRILASWVTQLEQVLDEWNASLPPLKEFILPGGSEAAARCHLARAICRRAERSLVLLNAGKPSLNLGQRYLNRLSDLLFVMARAINRNQLKPDVLWQPLTDP